MADATITLWRTGPSLTDDPIALVAQAGTSGARAAYLLAVEMAAAIAALAPSRTPLALTVLVARRGWRWAMRTP